MKSIVSIYTDGSCHTQLCVGAWAAVILIHDEKIVISGKEYHTTHNCMELLAVINSVSYVRKHFSEISNYFIVSDSQYVIGLIGRQNKFLNNNFKTKTGKDIRNISLVKEFLDLVNSIDVRFEKIKAHQKATETINYNIEVDKLSRQLVREEIKQNNKLI